MNTGPFPPAPLEHAVTEIIRSIARGEDACACILKSEGEIIENAKGLPCSMEEFISLNKSVNRVIRNIINLQILLQSSLESSEEMLQEVAGYGEYDDLEE